jgi:hypothetical protein
MSAPLHKEDGAIGTKLEDDQQKSSTSEKASLILLTDEKSNLLAFLEIDPCAGEQPERISALFSEIRSISEQRLAFALEPIDDGRWTPFVQVNRA